MRRTLGTDMQKHGTLKDTQGIYVQAIDASVQQAVSYRTSSAVLNGWTALVENMVLRKELEGSFSDSAKFGEFEKGPFCKYLILWLLR
jgi:hypothetical protein